MRGPIKRMSASTTGTTLICACNAAVPAPTRPHPHLYAPHTAPPTYRPQLLAKLDLGGDRRHPLRAAVALGHLVPPGVEPHVGLVRVVAHGAPAGGAEGRDGASSRGLNWAAARGRQWSRKAVACGTGGERQKQGLPPSPPTPPPPPPPPNAPHRRFGDALVARVFGKDIVGHQPGHEVQLALDSRQQGVGGAAAAPRPGALQARRGRPAQYRRRERHESVRRGRLASQL